MRLLMDEPTVLLLDEPSNDIDISTLELLEKLIKDWKHIVLFISHDETLIENTANVIIHLEQIMRKSKSRYTIVKDNSSFPGAVISISHDRKYIDEVCTKAYILTEEGLK